MTERLYIGYSALLLSLFILPIVASAQTIASLLFIIVDIINTAIPVVVGLALLVFFWGIAQFILYADNDERRNKGKSMMFWGIIVLFTMVAMGGILAILQGTFYFG